MVKVLVHISDASGRKFLYKSKNIATQNFTVLSRASEVKYQVSPTPPPPKKKKIE